MHSAYLWRVCFGFQILKRTNNIFELVSHKSLAIGGPSEIGNADCEDSSRKIHLKGNNKLYDIQEAISKYYCFSFEFCTMSIYLYILGQMLYMEEWKMIVFLGTPQMNDLDAMIRVGLFINDLSMHDFSR